MTCLEEDGCLLDRGLLEHVFVICCCCCCSVNALLGSRIWRSSASLNAADVNVLTPGDLLMLTSDERNY